MSLGHGAKIVTNGLVFAYDMGPNPGVNKSWKGAPTTNIFSAGRNTDNSASLFTYYFGTGASGTIGSEYLGKGITAKTAIITASTNVHTNFQVYMGNVSLTGGSTYTVSAMVWTDVAFTCRIGAIQNGSPFTTYIPLNEVSLSSGWNFIFSVGTYASTVTNARFQLDFGKAPVGATIKVIKPQIEQSNYATPYVNGTRSNTEALLDWTGNNTITANNITYNSDNTFEFNGDTSELVLSTLPQHFSGSVSMEGWFYFNTDNTRDILFGSYSASPGVNFERNTSNRLRLWWNQGANDVNSPNNLAPAQQWLHIVMIRNKENTTFDFYVNGTLEYSPTVSSADIATVGQPFRIGRDSRTGTTALGGKVGALKLHNRALTADEVKTNFNALRGRYGI